MADYAGSGGSSRTSPATVHRNSPVRKTAIAPKTAKSYYGTQAKSYTKSYSPAVDETTRQLSDSKYRDSLSKRASTPRASTLDTFLSDLVNSSGFRGNRNTAAAAAVGQQETSKPGVESTITPAKNRPFMRGFNGMIMPLEGKDLNDTTSTYGDTSAIRSSRNHSGLDYGAPVGTPIYAANNGVIDQVNPGAGAWGNQVILNQGRGKSTMYAHLDNFADGVTPGTKVKKGQVIGYVGSTGNSTGPHLHFETWQNGQHMDPRAAMTKQGKGGYGRTMPLPYSLNDTQRATLTAGTAIAAPWMGALINAFSPTPEAAKETQAREMMGNPNSIPSTYGGSSGSMGVSGGSGSPGGGSFSPLAVPSGGSPSAVTEYLEYLKGQLSGTLSQAVAQQRPSLDLRNSTGASPQFKAMGA